MSGINTCPSTNLRLNTISCNYNFSAGCIFTPIITKIHPIDKTVLILCNSNNRRFYNNIGTRPSSHFRQNSIKDFPLKHIASVGLIYLYRCSIWRKNSCPMNLSRNPSRIRLNKFVQRRCTDSLRSANRRTNFLTFFQ